MAFRRQCHEEANSMGIDQSERYPLRPPGEWMD